MTGAARLGAAAAACLALACTGGDKGQKGDDTMATKSTSDTDNPAESASADPTGASSPTGAAHPGEIAFADEVDDRTWTKKAADVPQTIAWVRVDDQWKAVAQIVITGTAERRRMTKLDADGAMLETTIQAPPPPPADDGDGDEELPTPSD